MYTSGGEISPVLPDGMAQAARAGELLQDVRLDAVYTSRLLRAQDTTYEVLKRNRHCPHYLRVHEADRPWYAHFTPQPEDCDELLVHVSESLNERYYGDLQGLNKDDAAKRFGAEQVLVNGGLNLSELDGWWAEAYASEVGWAIGDGGEHGDDPAWDAAEAESLYTLLENEVVPAFYSRDEHGIPTAWVARMRESMARLTPRFSANRVVREYAEQYYIPAALAYRERCADRGSAAMRLVEWQRALAQNWHSLRFGDVRVKSGDGQHEFETHVYLGGLAPEMVRVELYADSAGGSPPARLEMTRGQALVGTANAYAYHARVAAERPATDYTARVVPWHQGAALPLEAPYILWQR